MHHLRNLKGKAMKITHRQRAILWIGLFALTITLFSSLRVQANEDSIPKFVLIKLTRDQASAMCSSQVFTECMGFTQEKCEALSEQAIELCLAPLPDDIDPTTLQNSTLEECPQEIYKKEGFTEEKAKQCFAEGLAAAQKQQ